MKTKLMKKLWNSLDSHNMVDFMNSLLHAHLKKNKAKSMKPRNTKSYVGIEIECFSPLSDNEVMEYLISHDLEKYVQVGNDGSIESDGLGDYTYELRMLCTENELPKLLKKLGKFFKAGKFKTNDTCGLHVHLDMRKRKFEQCYNKLIKFQQILFPLVDSERWNNEYCEFSTIEEKKHQRGAINYLSYAEHKTIEVRLHHGTTDVKLIGNWIALLLKAIKSEPINDIKSKVDAVKWAGNNKKLKSYISSKFNAAWFKYQEETMNSEPMVATW